MAAPMDTDVVCQARKCLLMERRLEVELKTLWAAGRITGCKGGPELPSEASLLRQHGPGLHLSGITGLVRVLVQTLHSTSIGFANRVIEEDSARLQSGPTDHDLMLMGANDAALCEFRTALEHLAKDNPLQMAKLPEMGVARYLQERLLHLGHATLECVDAVVHNLESLTGRTDAKLNVKAVVMEMLSCQDRVHDLKAKKRLLKKADPAVDETAQLLSDAQDQLKKSKRALRDVEVRLERLQIIAKRGLGLVESIELVTKAEQTAWETHVHGVRKFGDRYLSLWLVQKETVLARSAADLAARLAKKLCVAGTGQRERLSNACVASIEVCVLDARKFHLHLMDWENRGFRDIARAAVIEELRNSQA